MASYLVIKNESSINRYLCKTTHDSVPYIKISTNETGGYLDLTTASTTGMRLNLSNVTGSGTITSSSSSEYDETTGYSGVSSRESTSGYTGYLSRQSTSGYTGKAKSTWNNIPAYQTNGSNQLSRTTSSLINYSGNSGTYKSFSYEIMSISTQGPYAYVSFSLKHPSNSYTSNNSDQSVSVQSWGNMFAFGNCAFLINNISNALLTSVNSTSMSSKNVVIFNGGNKISLTNLVLDNQKVTGNFRLSAINIAVIKSFTVTAHGSGTFYESRNGAPKLTIKYTTAKQSRYSGFSSSTNTVYSSSNTTNAALSSTTALTRSSAYLTSSNAVGNLSSTTALTCSSAYNVSSSTTNEGISSTTALTTTSSRSEEYETETQYTTHYRPCNTKTITVPKTISLESSYYTGIKSVSETGTLTITRSSQYDETTGYSGVGSKSSTSGYTGYLSRQSTSGYTGKAKSIYNDLPAYQTNGSNQLSRTTSSLINYSGKSGKYIWIEYVPTSVTGAGERAGVTFSLDASNSYTSNNNDQSVSAQSWGNVLIGHTVVGDDRALLSAVNSTSMVSFCAAQLSLNYLASVKHLVLDDKKVTGELEIQNVASVIKSFTSKGGYGAFSESRNSVPALTIKYTTAKQSRYSGFSSSTNTVYSSSNTTNAALSSTTALTRSSAYLASSEVIGNLSSTTALTRSSSYNTSSSTTNEILSSTTALTTTSSRSSEYTIPAGGTYTMSSHTSNWKMSSMGTSTRESTSYTTSVNAIADAPTILGQNGLEAVIEAGFYD